MNTKERSEYIAAFIEKHCMGVMGTKGVEYSRGEDDANSNFFRTATAMGVTAEQVNRIFGKKHEDAIDYAVKTDNFFDTSEPIEERIGDAINYLLILASLVESRRRGSPEKKMDLSPLDDLYGLQTERIVIDADGKGYTVA